jgi:lipopolysaccharide/colanic/teichoic acid biosynthesis glycosyltransferase
VGSLGDGGVAASPVAAPGQSAPPAQSAPTPGRPGRRPTRRSSSRDALSAPAGSRGKRALDLGIALLAAPVVVPIALVTAVLIRVTSRGPALFRQQRVGLGGESFPMYKFRTMRHDAEERLHSDPDLWQQYVDNDYKLPVSIDPRVTRLGKWLRRTSIDELPQLINVVAGSMSIVGPRPVTRAQFEAFADVVDAYQSVRPGMTGYWQVNGRSDVHYPERAQYDRHYVDEWSVWLDVTLIVRTPFAVIGGRGAH